MERLCIERGNAAMKARSEHHTCIIHVRRENAREFTLTVDTVPIDGKVWRRSQLLTSIMKQHMKDGHTKVKMPFSRTAVLQWATLQPSGAPTDAVWLCNTLDVAAFLNDTCTVEAAATSLVGALRAAIRASRDPSKPLLQPHDCCEVDFGTDRISKVTEALSALEIIEKRTVAERLHIQEVLKAPQFLLQAALQKLRERSSTLDISDVILPDSAQDWRPCLHTLFSELQHCTFQQLLMPKFVSRRGTYEEQSLSDQPLPQLTSVTALDFAHCSCQPSKTCTNPFQSPIDQQHCTCSSPSHCFGSAAVYGCIQAMRSLQAVTMPCFRTASPPDSFTAAENAGFDNDPDRISDPSRYEAYQLALRLFDLPRLSSIVAPNVPTDVMLMDFMQLVTVCASIVSQLTRLELLLSVRSRTTRESQAQTGGSLAAKNPSALTVSAVLQLTSLQHLRMPLIPVHEQTDHFMESSTKQLTAFTALSALSFLSIDYATKQDHHDPSIQQGASPDYLKPLADFLLQMKRIRVLRLTYPNEMCPIPAPSCPSDFEGLMKHYSGALPCLEVSAEAGNNTSMGSAEHHSVPSLQKLWCNGSGAALEELTITGCKGSDPLFYATGPSFSTAAIKKLRLDLTSSSSGAFSTSEAFLNLKSFSCMTELHLKYECASLSMAPGGVGDIFGALYSLRKVSLDREGDASYEDEQHSIIDCLVHLPLLEDLEMLSASPVLMSQLEILRIGSVGSSTAFPSVHACEFLTNLTKLSVLEFSVEFLVPQHELEPFGDTIEHLRCLESLRLGLVGSQLSKNEGWTLEVFAPCLLALTRLQDVMCCVLDRNEASHDETDRASSVVLDRNATRAAMKQIHKYVCGLRVPLWMLNAAAVEAEFEKHSSCSSPNWTKSGADAPRLRQGRGHPNQKQEDSPVQQHGLRSSSRKRRAFSTFPDDPPSPINYANTTRSKNADKDPPASKEARRGLPSAKSFGIRGNEYCVALSEPSTRYADNVLAYIHKQRKPVLLNEVLQRTVRPSGACKIGLILKSYRCFQRSNSVPEKISLDLS